MFEQKINADTILGLLNSKVLQYYKVGVGHVLSWVFRCSLAHPNPYSFFFMKTTSLEKVESFVMVTLPPWVALGFHLSNPMNTNGCRPPLSWFLDSAHPGDQRIGMLSLCLLWWQLKKEESWVPASWDLVPMMDHLWGN